MIKTNYGFIRGVDMGTYLEYRGVPYAKPPVGNRRFRPPEKPEKWDGVLDAFSFKAKCMQEEQSAEPYVKDFNQDEAFQREMSEDCLYLNIWQPKEHDGNCPVAFWIHGGAFMGGYATESEFDGKAYTDRGVILVTVEYRCNVFGFFAHPWLTEESERNISGNYGILDQIAALDWVYENIAAFGGNPKNITVFGQSAGAMSAQTLVSSKLTKGKIARAIMQSGGSYGKGLHRDILLKTQETYGEVLTEILGVKSLEELRGLSADTIEKAVSAWFSKIMPISKGLFLTPTMDGYVLEDGYYKLMDEGRIADIPYLLGSNKNDIDIMTCNNTSPVKTMLYEGAINFSHKLEELKRNPAYVYYFTRDLPGDGWGAYHSAELFYTFDTMKRCWRPWEEVDYELSKRMLDYWTNFMKNGNPNGDALPVWEPCSKEHPYIMEFHD